MATRRDPETGAWQCDLCNVFNERERVVCFECFRPRPRDVDGPPASLGTPLDVLREIEARREATSPGPPVADPPVPETP